MTAQFRRLLLLASIAALSTLPPFGLSAPSQETTENKTEHTGIADTADSSKNMTHTTTHPDAQWFGNAAFGLLINWDIASLPGALNTSGSMIPGRALAAKTITDPAERARIVRESDYNLDGKPNSITPNQYWSLAAQFNPKPPTYYGERVKWALTADNWALTLGHAGFNYVILTARNQGGFALWPSASGNFDTKNFMGGRDLLKSCVENFQSYDIKIGFYYSLSDWHFDRDYKNFLDEDAAKRNPWLPSLDADLKPRDPAAAHKAAYAAHLRTQIRELLTRYGKIDLLWLDGEPEGITNPDDIITIDEIRKLQPGIVIYSRFHNTCDYTAFENDLPATRPRGNNWAEFRDTWNNPDTGRFRAPGYILGRLAQCRAWGINYLLRVSITKDGELSPAFSANLATITGWMRADNDYTIFSAEPLPKGETASTYATALVTLGGEYQRRFLFVTPAFKPADQPYPQNQLPPVDEILTISGVKRPCRVSFLSPRDPLDYTYDTATRTIRIKLPVTRPAKLERPGDFRTKLVDVVEVELTPPLLE